MNKYAEYGKGTREDYLKGLAEDYGVDYEAVQMLADMLGPSEDFDGLINALEDNEDWRF